MTRRRLGLALLVAVLVGLALGGAAGTAGAAGAVPSAGWPGRQAEEDPPADAAADPFDRLAACVGAEGRLLVVLLVDESASLRETDPDDQRVAAARAALRSIDLLRGTDAGGGSVAIDVLVSTFSYDFAKVDDWSPLTADTREAVDTQIAGLADRDESMDTDFHNALDGARRALADRAAESTEDAGGNVCKAILLFTDGDFTLGPRTTEAQRERFGTTKTYAPGVELVDDEAVREATGLGVEALCREGGIADQVRTDRITLVSVPLGEGSPLLEALTTGSAEGRTCGDPETDAPGAYLPAPDTEELLRTFDLVASRIGGGTPTGDPVRPLPCEDDDDCEEGSVAFAVSPSFRRVHVFAAVPGDGSQVVLHPPDGDALTLEPGTDAEEDVVGIPVTARWIADRAVVVDLDVPADGTGAGDWRVTLVGRDGEATGLVQVVAFSDLVASLEAGSSVLLGGDATLTATIATRDGQPATEQLRDPKVTVRLDDPITGETATVDLAAEGEGFSGGYVVPVEVTSSALRASVRLEATTANGAALTSIAPDVVLPVRRPDAYPQVASPVLELTPIVGDGTAEGSVTLVAGQAAGCAWIEDLSVAEAPETAEPFALTVEGLGRDEGSCTPVEGPLSVMLEVEAGERAAGSVEGHVRVVLAQADGRDPIPTDVPITFEMSRGVDEAKRLVLAVGLMLGGLLAPLLLLVVINLLTTRFPDLGHVRGARIPVVVTSAGQVRRTDGGGASMMRLHPRDFAPLATEGGHRRFTWGGLVFGARTALNPFAEPYATVAPEQGTADVSREGRRTDLELGLVGSWLFLLDQDATRAGAPGEAHGVVVAFASAADVAGQAARLGGVVQERLPAVARRLAGLAGLSTVSPGDSPGA